TRLLDFYFWVRFLLMLLNETLVRFATECGALRIRIHVLADERGNGGPPPSRSPLSPNRVPNRGSRAHSTAKSSSRASETEGLRFATDAANCARRAAHADKKKKPRSSKRARLCLQSVFSLLVACVLTLLRRARKRSIEHG